MKNKILWFILSTVVLLLSIVLLVLSNIIKSKRPVKREEYELTDISIYGLNSFNFVEDKSIPDNLSSNLGVTEKEILDCYTGTCFHDIYYENKSKVCDKDNNCAYINESWIDHKPIIDHYCSEQCSKTGKSECSCNKPYESIGTCQRKIYDYYEEGKVCYTYNIINYWKGKKYFSNITNYSYLDNAILKDEKCPKGTKNCGIIDNIGNELCLNSNLICPINYISENKIGKDYSSVLIGNKTFYFGNDETTKRRIISRLEVDSDILLNKDNDQKIIIDDFSISGLLEDNTNLYKDINLEYDPYKEKEKDINSKGKSYLKISYTDNNVNLTSLRENRDLLLLNKIINREDLDTIEDKTKIIQSLGSIASVYLIIVFIAFLIYIIKYSKIEFWNCYYCFSKCFLGLLILIFFGLIITPLIYGIININKVNDAENLDSLTNYSTFKILNLVFVILGFFLITFLIFFIIFIPLNFYCADPIIKKINDKPNETNNIINN